MSMLPTRCKINASDNHHRTLMHYAAQSESSEMILFLYEMWIEPRETQDDVGQTPIALAAAEGKETTVSAVLSLKVNTSISRNDDLEPWQIALHNSHTAIARMLPEWVLHDGESQDSKAESEICRLVAADDHPGLSLAVASGANPDIQGRLRRTPLMSAVIADREEIVLELLSQRVDVNARCAFDRTALMCAATRGKSTIVTHILDAGGDASAVDIDGRTALEEALCRNSSEIADSLIEGLQRVTHPICIYI